jgi:hypothetical protein
MNAPGDTLPAGFGRPLAVIERVGEVLDVLKGSAR